MCLWQHRCRRIQVEQFINSLKELLWKCITVNEQENIQYIKAYIELMMHIMTIITSYCEDQSERSFYICNLKEALILYEPIRGKLLDKEPVTGNYNWKWEKKVHDIGANIKGRTQCNEGSWLVTRTGLKIDSATFTGEYNFKRTFPEWECVATDLENCWSTFFTYC